MSALTASRGAVLARRAALAALTLLIAAVLLAGLLYGYWVEAQHRLTVITPGRVYQSAAMPPQDLLAVAHRLGIQTVFDFRGDSGSELKDTAAEQRALQRAGIRYVHIPSSPDPAPATVAAFVRAMGPEVAAHRTVLLHCHDGEGRAVFYSAIYRIQFEGWSNQQAYRATTRLPSDLMFLTDLFPSLARLSPRNAKTPLILAFRRERQPGERAPVPAP